MVVEHIEGETLADRLMKGPLPVEDALTYGIEVAEALHQAGVVHRDVKPGHIINTKGGTKLLDFGLARLGAPTGLGGEGSHVATEAKPLTRESTILGTFQYMAPEQLEGQETAAGRSVLNLETHVDKDTSAKVGRVLGLGKAERYKFELRKLEHHLSRLRDVNAGALRPEAVELESPIEHTELEKLETKPSRLSGHDGAHVTGPLIWSGGGVQRLGSARDGRVTVP